MMMMIVTRSVAVDATGLFLFIRFLSNRSFLLFSSYDDDHETTLMVMTIMMIDDVDIATSSVAPGLFLC